MKDKVLVITGAAGSGKTTICKYICAKYHLPKVVTHTTRPPRRGEVDGVDYYFETAASFANQHLLEAVHYAGAQYGSSMKGLQEAWKQSPLACIVLDTAGAIAYQKQLGAQAIIMYLTIDDGAGSSEALRQRMIARGDDPKMIDQRIHSTEYTRDQRLPDALQGCAIVVKNDQLANAQASVDQIMVNILK